MSFLFTDIEGSTRLLRELGAERYRSVLGEHRRLLRAAIGANQGLEMGTEGDAFFVAFHRVGDATRAATEAQQALSAHAWPDGQAVRVRMGIHTTEARPSAEGYVGIGVHRAARIAAAAHGGQVLVSQTSADLLAEEEGATLVDLGEHRLKDLTQPQRIFQLSIAGMPNRFPPIRTLGSSLTNLPVQLTSFVGRHEELAQLREHTTRHRIVTLVGTGGTGKTRLMLQTGAEILDRYPDGVWLTELAAVRDAGLVVQEVVRAVGAGEEPGRPALDALTDFLRTKTLLLLVDNCEHVIGSAAQLIEGLVATSPRLNVLASSREALGVSGELVFQVPSLSMPPEGGVAVDEPMADAEFRRFEMTDTVRLFTDRAMDALAPFQLTPQNARAVAEICRRLDGIPLAIELAAARVSVLSVQEIAVRLSDRFRLLTGGRRTAVPRQQTLQALIDWSWDLLNEEDRRLLRRLSVFSGGWTLQAASAVTPEPTVSAATRDGVAGLAPDPQLETLDGLTRLVDRSLVIVEHTDPTRYRLLETIRQYANERLIAAGEAPAMRDRHAAHYLGLALEAEKALRGPDMISWLGRLDADLDNLRTALDWSFEADPERALRLTIGLFDYWRARSFGSEAIERMRRAAEVADSLPLTDAKSLRGRQILVSRVLSAASMAYSTWAEAAVAVRWAERAVELARAADDDLSLSEALAAQMTVTIFSGQQVDVSPLVAELIALGERMSNRWGMAMAHASAAMWGAMNGNLAEAEVAAASATEAAERSGNPFVIAYAALARGGVSDFAGQLPEARRWLTTAGDAFEQMGDKRFALIARSDLAHALRHGGALQEAEALYRETLPGWQHAGNRGAVANQLECLAYIEISIGEGTRSARLLGAAEAIRQQADAPLLQNERSEHDVAVAQLRKQFGSGAMATAWAQGAQLTLDEAVALALSASGPPRT